LSVAAVGTGEKRDVLLAEKFNKVIDKGAQALARAREHLDLISMLAAVAREADK